MAILSADEEHRDRAVYLFESILLSWVHSNPAYRGVHYISAMECGLRLIAVCQAVDLIRPYLTQPDTIWPAVVSLVNSHASFIVHRLSLYSSSGNHTIAECAGLVYAGTLFPELSGAGRWKNVGLTLLQKEVGRQFLADGGGVEQAFGYQLFITDLANLVARLLASRNSVSMALEQSVAASMTFLGQLFDENWTLPNIGDNDGGYALNPNLRISHTRCLPTQKILSYATSGYSLIRDENKSDRLLIFDHGELGMPPSYGHGHSDCLSLYWRENGEPLLIDPGTFTYTGDARWRAYFRGVTAHNTVSVDRQDQAKQQGAFMWSQPFDVALMQINGPIDGHGVIIANHSGYMRFGIRHYRALIYNPEGKLMVWDFLKQSGENAQRHELSLWWHMSGTVDSDEVHEGCYLLRGEKGICFRLETSGGEIFRYSADETNPQGWDSPVYGQKIKATTIEVRQTTHTSHNFYTYVASTTEAIRLEEKAAFASVVQTLRPICK
ncbi:MAG: alginate lyase family protein [Nitrospira sp.]|nr:alginate lyase family protein [Nitrospira sp.]